MTRILLLLSIGATLLQCQGDSKGMKAISYVNGTIVERPLSASEQKSAAVILEDLFAGTEEMLRVHVSDETIDAIRKTDTAVEFVFDTPVNFTSRMRGTFAVRRLLLPVTGDYAGSATDPVTTLFVADEQGFISGPLRNPVGRPLVLKLRELVSPGSLHN